VVTGLWDSFADDAFTPRRRARQSISIPTRCTCSITRANISPCAARSTSRGPIQGWPVIVQAGASEPGRQTRRRGPRKRYSPRSRASRWGREFLRRREGPGRKGRPFRATHIKILPGCFRRGRRTPWRKARRGPSAPSSTASSHYANGIGSLSIALGHDASKFDPDGPPAPRFPESNASKSGRQRGDRPGAGGEKPHRAAARPAPRRLFPGFAMVGTPKDHRRRDGGMARHRRLRRIHRAVPLTCRADLEDFVQLGGPGNYKRRGIFPPRIRRQDAARESRGCRGQRNRFFGERQARIGHHPAGNRRDDMVRCARAFATV